MKKFLAKKSVFEITKFTTLDYKDHLACILWFTKCNMRCSYCYNKDVVEGEGIFSNKNLLDFLKTRVNKLDAVVLSGGECTLNPDIATLCQEIKKLGFKIKIDTNGLNTKVLENLIDNSLIDYIALDYKATSYKYEQITKTILYDNFSRTLDMLVNRKFSFEVRTTVHGDLLNEEDINMIIKDLSKREYTGTYYIQNYLHVEDTFANLGTPTKALNKNLLLNLIDIEFRN